MGAKSNSEQQFILVAVKGTHHEPVKEGVVTIVQSERTRLKKEPAWKGWLFQVRTPEGYKAVPILKVKRKNHVPQQQWRIPPLEETML